MGCRLFDGENGGLRMEHVQAGWLIVGSEIGLARQVDACVAAGWLCGGRGTGTAAEFGLAAAGQGV